MEALSRLVVAFCDLVEAEAKLLRRRAVEAATGATLVLVAGFCVALGLALLGRGGYLVLARLWGPVAASGIPGGLFVALGGWLGWTVHNRIRS